MAFSNSRLSHHRHRKEPPNVCALAKPEAKGSGVHAAPRSGEEQARCGYRGFQVGTPRAHLQEGAPGFRTHPGAADLGGRPMGCAAFSSSGSQGPAPTGTASDLWVAGTESGPPGLAVAMATTGLTFGVRPLPLANSVFRFFSVKNY